MSTPNAPTVAVVATVQNPVPPTDAMAIISDRVHGHSFLAQACAKEGKPDEAAVHQGEADRYCKLWDAAWAEHQATQV
jgi:hypothetical protein